MTPARANPSRTAWGLVAEFERPGALLAAAERARAAGYRRLEAYTPFPLDGLDDALGLRPTRLPFIVLAGGLLGGCGGYFMMWYSAVIDYPLNVGGRPLHSWPSFIPITFELTVLCASLAAVLGMVLLNGLPRIHHPVFAVPDFARASHDRFFLSIEADAPDFDLDKAEQFLADQGAVAVSRIDDDRTT